MTRSVDIEWEGLNTIQGYIINAPDRIGRLARGEMSKAAHAAFRLSQRQVPVASGTLKNSGDLQINGDEYIIGYGGAAAQYAMFVHENLTARHKPPTKAKFVEDPVRAIQIAIENDISIQIDGAIVGSYPQSPAEAVAAEVAYSTKRFRRGKTINTVTGRKIKRMPKPMSGPEISAALKRRKRK